MEDKKDEGNEEKRHTLNTISGGFAEGESLVHHEKNTSGR
jgi:hypothetical protein